MPRPCNYGPKLNRLELILGWIYVPIYLVGLSLLLQWLFPSWDIYQLNLAYFYVNFFAIVLIFRRFLIESLQAAPKLYIFSSACVGYGIFYLGNLLMTMLLLMLPEFQNPADSETTGMVVTQMRTMVVCGVLLGPIVEECIARGLIFAPLARKNRLLGYVASTLFFSALHLWQYVGTTPIHILLLSLLNYVPASVALARAYERSGSIWSPILLHMLINGMSMWVITVIS